MTEGAQAREEWDVVVIGSGSAGEVAASELARACRRVVVVERGLVGGECAYVACIPSKALLLAARAHVASRPTGTDVAAWRRAIGQRDEAARHRDDEGAARGLARQGIDLVRGTAEVTGPGTVRVRTDDAVRELRWREALVVATGSAAALPPIEGLAQAPTWTSEEALTAEDLPDRVAVLGGGPIGCELGQVYAAFGSTVTLVETAPTLLPSEAGWAGAMIGDVLRAGGVDVRTGTTVTRVESGGRAPVVLHTDDGGTVEADRLLVAVGTRPATEGLGLEQLGITPGPEGELRVDGRMRVLAGAGTGNGGDGGDGGAGGSGDEGSNSDGTPLPDVFAIGDVTALSPYTHSANHQARAVAAHLLGRGRDLDRTGVPRAVYTDPPVFCVGETADAARERGVDVRTARFDVTGTARAFVERTVDPGDRRPGGLELVVDAATGVVIGASAVGPEADSWGAELALAVRTRTTVDVLAHHEHAFPSWTEAIHPPARELAEALGTF